MLTFCKIIRNASKKATCTVCSNIGNTNGISSAEANDEISTYVVIVEMFPPNLPVTTGAAEAAGPMIHVSTASQSSATSPGPSKKREESDCFAHKMTAMLIAINSS